MLDIYLYIYNWSKVIHARQTAQTLQMQDECNIQPINHTSCVQVRESFHKSIVVTTGRVHHFHNYRQREIEIERERETERERERERESERENERKRRETETDRETADRTSMKNLLIWKIITFYLRFPWSHQNLGYPF